MIARRFFQLMLVAMLVAAFFIGCGTDNGGSVIGPNPTDTTGNGNNHGGDPETLFIEDFSVEPQPDEWDLQNFAYLADGQMIVSINDEIRSNTGTNTEPGQRFNLSEYSSVQIKFWHDIVSHPYSAENVFWLSVGIGGNSIRVWETSAEELDEGNITVNLDDYINDYSELTNVPIRFRGWFNSEGSSVEWRIDDFQVIGTK